MITEHYDRIESFDLQVQQPCSIVDKVCIADLLEL